MLEQTPVVEVNTGSCKFHGRNKFRGSGETPFSSHGGRFCKTRGVARNLRAKKTSVAWAEIFIHTGAQRPLGTSSWPFRI